MGIRGNTMKTIFNNQPFGNYDMGRYFASIPNDGARVMGQPETAFSAISDVFKALGIEEMDIVRLIDAMPVAQQGPYRAKLEECRKMGYTSILGARCVYDLFQDLKDVAEGKKQPAPVLVQPIARPEPSFPLIPVALGTLAAAGIVWFIASR
jgi:hypothetical protein